MRKSSSASRKTESRTSVPRPFGASTSAAISSLLSEMMPPPGMPAEWMTPLTAPNLSSAPRLPASIAAEAARNQIGSACAQLRAQPRVVSFDVDRVVALGPAVAVAVGRHRVVGFEQRLLDEPLGERREFFFVARHRHVNA